MDKFLVSQTFLAGVLDMTARWVQRLESQKVFKKSGKKYDLAACVTAYVQFLRGSKDETLVAVQKVFLETKTRKLQLEADQLEEILILKTELQKERELLVRGCEENFKNLPYRLVPVLMMVEIGKEEKLLVHILKHEITKCWRDLAGIPRKKTALVNPWDIILVCLGLITGDTRGEVILERCSPPFKQRVKVSDLLERYGNGVAALRNPLLGGDGPAKN